MKVEGQIIERGRQTYSSSSDKSTSEQGDVRRNKPGTRGSAKWY